MGNNNKRTNDKRNNYNQAEFGEDFNVENANNQKHNEQNKNNNQNNRNANRNNQNNNQNNLK